MSIRVNIIGLNCEDGLTGSFRTGVTDSALYERLLATTPLGFAVVYASVLHKAKEGEEELKMLMTHIFDGGVYDRENGVLVVSDLVKTHGLDTMERRSLECDDLASAFASVPRANSTLTLLVYHH